MTSATKTKRPKAEPKVAREVAVGEFERMCVAYRIELDESELDEGEVTCPHCGRTRGELGELRDPIVRDIMTGAIVVGDDGNPTYTAPGGAKGVTLITFHPPTGATLMALETYTSGNMKNFAAAMADMTHLDKSDFARMDLRDVQACIRLAKLFLADR